MSSEEVDTHEHAGLEVVNISHSLEHGLRVAIELLHQFIQFFLKFALILCEDAVALNGLVLLIGKIVAVLLLELGDERGEFARAAIFLKLADQSERLADSVLTLRLFEMPPCLFRFLVNRPRRVFRLAVGTPLL